MGKDLLLTVEGNDFMEGKVLHYGMVGGGQGAFIGDSHRKAINLDGQSILVAGCFSRDHENCLKTGMQLRVSPDRCYKTFEEMAKKEAEREDGIDYVVIVTPNDLLRSIAGEFVSDQDEKAQRSLIERADGSFLVSGAMSIDALADRLGIKLPDDRDYATVAGHALDRLRHLPQEGESFEDQDWVFEIVDMDGRKIDKLIVRGANPEVD